MIKNSLKIIHCGTFKEYNNGKFFYGLERKISSGFIQNGHFVYDFSYRDWEKSLRLFKIKNSGLKRMNEKLIKICDNIKPDILLLGKAEKIKFSTLERIKKTLPKIKIVLWYVDHLKENKEFFDKLTLLDTFFYANAKPLEFLSKTYKVKTSFFPNISDRAFDRSYDIINKKYDILYIASDYKEDIRHDFAKELLEFSKKENLKLKLAASLGYENIWGDDFHRVISNSKIAINFNRDDKKESKKNDKLLGASDRMAQFLGSGICTLSPYINGFEKLFEDKKHIVYFDDFEDCFKKILAYLKDDKYKQIAKEGQKRSFDMVNAKRVTKFMEEVIYEKNFSSDYEWSEFIYEKSNN